MQGATRQLSLFGERAFEPPKEPGELPGFSIRESARAKRLSIKVHPRGTVEVVVPRRTRPADVRAFVEESRDWIVQSLAAFDSTDAHQDTRPPTRIILPAIAAEYAVSYRKAVDTASLRCREFGNTLVLTGPTSDHGKCRQALKRWLSKVARREFAPRLDALARELELPFDKLQIRAQRTCWGSRSSSGTISLNLCLLFVRPDVLRYLMVHELCHGRHMNHSRAFWRRVARHEPRYRYLDRALGDSWRSVPAWLEIY